MSAKQDGREIPNHIAVIMDGNGRWAKQKGAMRSFGHRSGVQAVREITEGCSELGVNYLTLYACLLYTSPSPRDVEESRMPSSA